MQGKSPYTKGLLLAAVLFGCMLPGAVAQPTKVARQTKVAQQTKGVRFADSLQVQLGTTGSFSSADFQPLWIESNRFGLLSEEAQDASTFIRAFNSHQLPAGKDTIGLSYGFNLVNNRNFERLFLQQAYLKIRYGPLEFRAGRYEEISGEVEKDLSSGSLGISGNALPIPRIGLAFPEYTNIPFTGGWLQIKGVFSHGWMGSNRYMKNTWLHEKALYGRIGRGRFKVYGGAQHFGLWGGERGSFQLDRSFRGFLDVLFVREANDGSLPESSGIRPNRAGDQRGLLEFGAELETELGIWHFYHQTPFESGKGISIQNIDRVAGISLDLKDPSVAVKKVLAEFIYTKQMEGFGGSQQQSYYNNGIYATGWEYENRIIGTPLFLNRTRGANFLSIDLNEPYKNANIVNNRVIGGHLGIMHRYTPRISARTLLTYTVNYGTHRNFIHAPQRQFYSLHEGTFSLPEKGLVFSIALAYDTGMFYDAFGGMIGVKYQLANKRRAQASTQ